MLRLAVLFLLLLNVLYFSWAHGWLQVYGWGPLDPREPQRLARQVHPEAIRIVDASQASPAVCLQSASLTASQADQVRALLQTALARDEWTLQPLASSSRWLIYVGPFANAGELSKKRAQLQALKLRLYPLDDPALELGLSLGSFASQTLAQAELEALTARGLRTARVLERAGASGAAGFVLRLTQVSPQGEPKLRLLDGVLGVDGLRPCDDASSVPAAGQ